MCLDLRVLLLSEPFFQLLSSNCGQFCAQLPAASPFPLPSEARPQRESCPRYVVLSQSAGPAFIHTALHTALPGLTSVA